MPAAIKLAEPLPERVQTHLRLLTDDRQALQSKVRELEELVERQAAEIAKLRGR